MHQNIEKLTSESIKLPMRGRLEIVNFLHFLDNRSSDSDDVQSVWEKEIMDRVRSVDEGTAIGIDYDQALQKIEKCFIQ
ncbi:MAG: hypothetical protein AB7S77_20830 [Desulfatirhabdiaceae bacterium]